MCGVICECEYTYSFVFRHDEVPDIIRNLSKTFKRVLHLIQEVSNGSKKQKYVEESERVKEEYL